MAVIDQKRIESFEIWRQKFNQLSARVGDSDLLTTTAQQVVDAINEHDTEIGDMNLIGIAATTVSGALRELRADVGDAALDTTASTLTDAINEHEADLGTMALNTSATNITAAINEHEADLGTMVLNTAAANVTAAINEHEGDIGNMTLTGVAATDLSAAIRELADEKLNKTIVSPDGTLTDLNTNQKTTLVGAINELDGQVGSMSLDTAATNITAAINEHEGDIGNMTLTGYSSTDLSAALREIAQQRGSMTLSTTAGDLTDAINELVSTKVELDSQSIQNLTSDLNLASGYTATIDGTLRIAGSLIVESGGAGALNITDTFLNLGDSDADIPQPGGVRILRGDGGGTTQLGDVELLWDEGVVGTDPARAWKLVGMDDAGDIAPATSVVTYYNAKELITSNTESGINVTWDSVNQNFDFDVDDFTITLSGDVAGSGTVTDLNNVTINTTVQPDSVALGTDTTGDYVATMQGTSNEVTVSGSGTEGRGVTVGLVANPIVSGITAGNVTVGRSDDNTITTTSGGLTLNSAIGETTIADNLEVSGNAVFNGNLTVSGTVTTINTEEISLSDNIIVLNGDETGAPSQSGGIEVERGTSSNVSLVWNETTDRWEIQDTIGTHQLIRPGVDNIAQFIDGDGTTVNLDTNDSLQFSEGSGIDVNFTDTGEPSFDLRFTNTDRGSSQNIFKNVELTQTDTGFTWGPTGTVVADSNNDKLTFVAGNAGVSLEVDSASDALKVSHADTSSVGNLSSNNSGNTFVQDINFTFDAFGHVTGATASTGTVNQTQFTLRDGDTTARTIGDNSAVHFVESPGNGISMDINWTSTTDMTVSVTNTKPFDGLTVRDGDNTAVTLNNSQQMRFLEGSGIDVNWTDTSTGSSVDPYDLTVTNTDRGSSQNIFKNLIVENSAGTDLGTISANTNNDTFYVQGVSGVDTTVLGSRVTVKHADTSSVGDLNINESGRTAIQDLSLNFDGFGHVTGASYTTVETLRVYDVAGATLF